MSRAMADVEQAISVLRSKGREREARIAEEAWRRQKQNQARTPDQQSTDAQVLSSRRVTVPMLESALQNALDNGRNEDAARLGAMLTRAQKIQADRAINKAKGEDVIEFGLAGDVDPYEGEAIDIRNLINLPQKYDPGPLGGVGETATALGTAITGGTVGTIAGTLEGLATEIVKGEYGTPEAAKRIEQTALKRAGQLTYSPRSEAGQRKTAATAKALEPLAALGPTAELAMAGALAAPLSKTVRDGAARAGGAIKERVSGALSKADDLTPEQAAAAAARADEAAALGFTGDSALMLGQRTRSPQQLTREKALAATDEGSAIRARAENQNAKAAQILDDFVDETGATTTTTRAVGELVDDALRARMNRDKTRMRAIREDARKAGEMEAPVLLQGLDDYLNTNRAARTTDDIMNKVQRELEVKGLSTGNFRDGTLKINEMTLNQAEGLRVFINKNTDWMKPQDTPMSVQLKNIIDASTKDLGGGLYKKYRDARVKFANDYENASLIKRLTDTKRGTNDRVVALENVLKETVFSPRTSLDMLRQFRRIIQTQGKEGKQAWREIQGGTLRQIKDAALKGVRTNQRGDKVFSASQLDRVIKMLDDSGKLDLIFTPKGAEKLRQLNSVAKTIMTVPPGAANNGSAATVIAGMMDIAISAGAGVAAPITSALRFIGRASKDAKLRGQIKKALGD